MARITLGLGTSHSPQLNTPPDTWLRHGEGDQRNPYLFNKAGKRVSWEELLAEAGSSMEGRLAPEQHQARFERCNRAIAELQSTLKDRQPDVVIVFGDDQGELFPEDFRPPYHIHWGEELANMPTLYTDSPNPLWRDAAWAYGQKGAPTPVPSALAKHVVSSLMADGFDVAQSRHLPAGAGVGHAFGFIQGRIMNGLSIPLIPVVLNTMYGPNQPSPSRCFDLGRAIARAVEAWPEDLEVCMVGSGGMTHFVIDEDFDQQILAALRDKDAQALRGLPADRLNSGTSEIRSWLGAAGALQESGLAMELIDYVPCYRSLAGTGVAMTFARWL